MAEGRRILLVDDDENVLFVLRASLYRQDGFYEITTARDGRAALALAEASPFDLLITDVRLPGMDGVMLTEAMRAAAPRLGVLWITAYGCRELAAKIELLHVNACLEKPVEIAVFRDSSGGRLCLISTPSDYVNYCVIWKAPYARSETSKVQSGQHARIFAIGVPNEGEKRAA